MYIKTLDTSSQKITDEAGKTLHNHFLCGIWKFDTLLSIVYSCYYVAIHINDTFTDTQNNYEFHCIVFL